MQPRDQSKNKRKQLTSEDLKRRLYEKGIHGNSMPSLKNALTNDKSNVLYVNLNSSLNKRQLNQSPKILKKTASAFGKVLTKEGHQNNNPKSFFPSITANQFGQRKKSPFNVTNNLNNQTVYNKSEQGTNPISKTAVNFYSHKRTDSEPQQEVAFNSSFYKNDSFLRQNQTRMTKRLVEKMSGHVNKFEEERGGIVSGNKERSKFFDEMNQARQQLQQKDQIIEKQQLRTQDHSIENIILPPFGNTSPISTQNQQSSLQQYISLITKNIPNVDEFLYLIRHSSQTPESDNIYQLQIIDYQQIKSKDKDPYFQYYTISKKGFCHYLGGKPIEFIDLHQWLEQKEIYEKIKKLNFFSRFRRWKTIKMWIKKVVRHRIQKCSSILEEKLFILNPTVRSCILDINFINLQMEKSLAIISRNQGSYTLQSFKHCQQKTRRQAASIVEQFSRKSRQSVRKCFQDSLQNLKQVLKTKNSNEDKNFTATSHNPKDNAFQVLGFPAKMSYQHRSKLRKLTGRFVRFSYLVDFIHLNGLASIFKTQIDSFSIKLNNLQIQSEVEVHCSNQPNKGLDQNQKQKMFNIQLIFRPCQISQSQTNLIPMEIFDISMKIEKALQIFNPLYHIKQKPLLESSNKVLIKEENLRLPMRKYIPTICDLWLTLKPTLDNIFDQLSFLIKESMTSLKFFERWSKHRQMQKYINILEEWDDIVSENWQICQNDNLDPISIIQNLQLSMSKIKQMIQMSESKLTEKIIEHTTQPLNIYWENTQADTQQLLTNDNIQNGAQTIQFYLAYMIQHIQRFQQKIPNSIELGIFSISLDKMKKQIIEFMRDLCDGFKQKLPDYVQEHTVQLNVWLNEKSNRLREEIHNIDDFVRLNKSLKEIEIEFNEKKDLCNDLGHIYQTMYNHKIESKKRKEFEVQTLKSKDQLEQLLINVEQNIERKTEFFTREVSRYHIPNLLKEIQKISDNIASDEFQSLKSSSSEVIRKLLEIKTQYGNLKSRKSKCLQYLAVLKLSQVDISELDELEKQINARLEMWENMELFDEFIEKINVEIVSEMDLEKMKNFVSQKRSIVKEIQTIHNKPNNQVLQLLKEKVQKYHINIPLLQGFNEKLSQSHWDQISQIIKEYPYLDLRKKQFTLKKFLDTEIGKQAKKIEFIFSKAKVQNQLQLLYSEVENCWMNTLVKSRVQSKFIVISNPQTMRDSFDSMLKTLCTILSNPFSSTLRQYSVTYDLLIQYYNTFENWMSIQQRLLKIDAQCKLMDVKKIPDYSQFQNCQKIYKNVMKLFSNRNIDNGVKMSKLFVNGLDQRLQQMDDGLKKVEDNIKTILEEHRKNYPPFYLFSDEKLFKIVTQPTNPSVIQSTAKCLLPSIQKLEFQGERISGIYNFDQQKLPRNMISTTLDIEQILLQLSDTITDIGRKNMRSCRYKAVETNLFRLLPIYQTQYLLATNKIDFTNYTQISIDNQVQACDSLKEFYKVMKKDITEDLKIRSTLKPEMLSRYDTLILQTLFHEELLSLLIKKNVMNTTDFEWQNQLRFYWDEANNNDDNNIIVKQCHAKLKYGNEYIGSRSKVVISLSANLLYSLSSSQTCIFLNSQYSLERVLNYTGHRLATFDCSTHSSLKPIINFLIGNWYSQTLCFYKNFDYLPYSIQQQLIEGTQVKTIKQTLLKKNAFNLKENDKKESAVFLGVSHQNKVHDLRSQCRVVQHVPVSLEHVKNLLKIKGQFDNDISDFLLKLFEMVNYLEEKSHSFNITLEDFLENKMLITETTTKPIIFQQFLKYAKPKIGLDNFSILEETVKLFLTSQTNLAEPKDQIIETIGSKNFDKHTKEKQKSGPKISIRTRDSKLLGSKSQQKMLKPLKSKLLKKPSQQVDEDRQKYKSVKEALTERKILILTGIGQSKLHCIKNLYKHSYRIIEVFSFLSTSHDGLLKQKIMSDQSGSNILLYFNGIDAKLLQQLEQIWNNENYEEVRKKIDEKNILVVIGVEKLSHFDYSALSAFYVINVDLQDQYLIQVAREWSQKQMVQPSQDKDKSLFMKFITETLIPIFDNWGIKDIKQKEKCFYIFLTHLKSLLPVTKLYEAMVYCFILVFSSGDTDCIKLQFLVKKLIGDDKLNEDQKVHELVYCSVDNRNTTNNVISQDEGLYKLKNLFDKYQQSLPQMSKDVSLLYLDHIITPQLYHYCSIMQRIFSYTSAGIFLIGPPSSGKTSLYEIYKHLNFNNKSYLRLTMCDNVSKETFVKRIMNNFDVCSLKQIKGRVNFQKAIIMIDDISMDKGDYPFGQAHHFHNPVHDAKKATQVSSQKLTFIKQLLHYSSLQYPSQNPHLSKNFFHAHNFKLSDINFILSGQQQLQQFKQCTIPIYLNSQQHETKSIFTMYLRQRLPYMEVSDLMVSDIVSTTMDICRKIGVRNAEFEGMELSVAKLILKKFILLKTKETSTAITKEVERYWVYLLHEHLGNYDRKPIVAQYQASQSISSTCSLATQQKIKPSSLVDPEPQSVILRELKSLNLHEFKPSSLHYSFLHNKDISSIEQGKKIEYVKDIKKVFNNINERIEKYNESENKRFGPQFDYIHFDQLIVKIIKLSNNLGVKDYFLSGRKGSGKQTLIKLVAYLQGSNYKPVTESLSLKQTIIDIFANTNITTMSSYLIVKYLSSSKDVEQIKQFYYTDFENEILNSKELQKPIKILLKDKDKEQKLLVTSAGSKTAQKTFAGLGITPDYYIAPKPKLSQEDSIRYRNAIRIVLMTNDREFMHQLPLNIKTSLMLDEMEEIPIGSVQEYNVKFLDAQEIKYAPRTSQLLAQIWNFQKYNLFLSLKSYDDSIRLFSSFMVTLMDQIKEELTTYGRIIELFNQLRKLNEGLEVQVEDLQGRIRSVNELLIIEETEERKEEKATIETELHKKSSCFSKCQKIIEMLSILVPFFKEKHSLIQRYVLDSEYFQESLVVASCYFTFLSELPFKQRREVLNRWYKTDKIPVLMNSQPAQSFLTLFNLHKEDFNAEPIDDLEDFYENMAIVFNSVKPVIIKDISKRGKQWLETVCTFFVVSERENNFVDIICENLVKPSNILIEVTNQQTMNSIPTSFINTLLYLGEATQTITIKGQQLKVSPQAKFYILLSQCVSIPPQLQHDFTVVSFSQSEPLLNKSLEYSYMSNCQPEAFYPQLQTNKKIRGHKLEREALMEQIAEIIYASFDQSKNDKDEDEEDKDQPDAPKADKQDDITKIMQKTREELEQHVVDITDKVMTRGQNLANKLKEKEELFKDIEQKYANNIKSNSKYSQIFITQAKTLLSILHLMSSQSQKAHPEYVYPKISHQEFVKKITLGLRRGFILPYNKASLYLFAIKVWGEQYVENDFWAFLLAVFHVVDRLNSQQKRHHQSSNKLQKIGDKNTEHIQLSQLAEVISFSMENSRILKECLSFDDFKTSMQEQMIELLSHFTYQQTIPYLQFTGTISNLQQGEDRRIVLNNIWCTGKPSKFSQKLQESLKVVNVQVKDQSSPQNQIKKFIFEENILLISSIDLLELTLENLQKLGSHEKTLYFKCPMASKTLKRVHFLSKKYNVSQLNHIYQDKNTLLAHCLQKLQKQRELKKLSSVTNIKSMKSIANINSDSNKRIPESKQSQQKRLFDSIASNTISDSSKLKLFEESEVRLTKTMKTQKAILLQSPEDEQISTHVDQVTQKLFAILKCIYKGYNLFEPYVGENQFTELCEYIKTCNSGQDQEYSFVEKVRLLEKTMSVISQQPFTLINTEIDKKIKEIHLLLQNTVKQSENQCQQASAFCGKLQQLLLVLTDNTQDSLLEASNKAKKVHFQNEHVSYFRSFFTLGHKHHLDEHDPFDVNNILRRSRKIYDSINSINDQPLSVKRNSRKSINVIFKKDDLKEKMSGSPTNALLTNTNKKPGIKRLSKQSIQTMPKKELESVQSPDSNLAPLLLEVEYKKLCSKIITLTSKIQTAIQRTPNHSSSLQLLLLLLQDKVPGTWLFILQNSTFIDSLSSLFKKYMHLQQDMSFCLDKIKRSKYAQIDFAFLEYPKDYIQLHFKRKISYNDSAVYLLANSPTSEELQSSLDHLKIASIQGSGWRFSNEPNVIDILSGGEKPTVSQGKILTSCCFIRKESVQILNLTPIDVYETRTSVKPIMKVYANCKKQTVFNSTSNNLSLYLKEYTYM